MHGTIIVHDTVASMYATIAYSSSFGYRLYTTTYQSTCTVLRHLRGTSVAVYQYCNSTMS